MRNINNSPVICLEVLTTKFSVCADVILVNYTHKTQISNFRCIHQPGMLVIHESVIGRNNKGWLCAWSTVRPTFNY